MKKAISKIGLSGFATIAALMLSFAMIHTATDLTQEVSAGECAVCNGSCGSTGCTYYCASDSSISCKRHQSRFMCDGRINTACNENNGVALGSRPDLTDPQYWCKSFQFDSNADNGAYSMVYVGDGGETCTHKGGKPSTCDPDKLDWDCENKPVTPPPTKPVEPPNNPPACEYLKIDKTTVTSLTEPIRITMKGNDPDNVPQRLLMYAAAGGQTNRNPGNFYCTNSDPNNSEYSFYCGGVGSWVLIASRSSANEFSTTTNFKELTAMVNSLNSGYQGNLNARGINITANVVGSFSGDICSSNIARNNGNGAFYNNGAWNQACEGGCNVHVSYKAPAKPVEPEPVSCNDTCGKTSDCEGDLICSNGSCRNPECTGEKDCTCPTPPAQCNDSCGKEKVCEDGYTCHEGQCRNPKCTEETDCTCAAKPSEPRCGDNSCNQDSERCENNKSCATGDAVECRSDCTYCGDGIVDGSEECDYNKEGTTNCTKECKIINEHPPTDTAGFIDDNLALIGGFGMLTMGVGSVALAAPIKKKFKV